MPTAGVSGLAVGLTTVGGVLVVAAIRNQSPIDVVKVVLKQPTSGTALGKPFASIASGVARVGSVAAVGTAVVEAGNSIALVTEARKHLGKKYVFGAVGPNTFDCSGLVVYCLRKTLMPNCKRFTTFNESSYLASQGWKKVSPSDFQAGDILVRSGHTAIAVSGDRMIHAPHAGTVVKDASIYNKNTWWGYRHG